MNNKKLNPILKTIISLAKGIAKTSGPNREIVVRDLSHPKTSVIKIFNNVVTERKVEDGIKYLVWHVLRFPNFTEVNNITPLKDRGIEINNADIINILDYLISQTIQENGMPVGKTAKGDKINLVGFLDQKGIFKVSYAVNWVANRLKVSNPTIYSYLNVVRSKKDKEILKTKQNSL